MLRVLEEKDSAVARVQEQAQLANENATHSRERDHNIYEVLKKLPDDSALPDHEWQGVTASHEAELQYLVRVGEEFRLTNQATSAFAAASTLGISMVVPLFEAAIARGSVVEPAIQNLRKSIHRPTLANDVRTLMTKFGLDKTGKGRPALTMLNEALAVYARPASMDELPAAVLLPARDSIHVALDDLLKRIPQSGKTGSAPSGKIKAISNHCRLADFDTAYFERLATNADELVGQNKLSAGKQAVLTREQIIERLDDSLTFYAAFLGSLDLTKVRP